MATPPESERTAAAVEATSRGEAEAPLSPAPVDWHALAANAPTTGTRTRRSTSGRSTATSRPGQLSLGALRLPRASPEPEPANRAPARPVPVESGCAPTGPSVGERRGVLVAGRFPVTLPGTSPSHSSVGVPRPRPGDWDSAGVRSAMEPFTLPAPSAPDDATRDPTIPVFATQLLEQRLGRLRSGQTLEVEPGEYRGTLTIRTPVTIRIAGEGEVRIRSTTGPAVVVKGCGATLVGLTLRSEHGDAVVVESPAGRGAAGGYAQEARHLELDGCRIVAARSGIALGTALVRLGVTRCEIAAGDGPAIRLPEGAVAAIADSRIGSTGGPGIAGESGVTVALSGSRMTGCGGPGLRLGDAAKLWMDDGEPSTVADNQGSGIVLGRGSSGAVVGATLTGNGGWGLIAPGGDVTVRGGAASGNALGDISR